MIVVIVVVLAIVVTSTYRHVTMRHVFTPYHELASIP